MNSSLRKRCSSLLTAHTRISRYGKPATQTIDKNILKEANEFRDRIRKSCLIDARLIPDLVNYVYGHFFQAYLDCPNEQKFIFTIEPYNREEVSLVRYQNIVLKTLVGFETWYSERAGSFSPQYRRLLDTKVINVDASIDDKEFLKGTAQLEFVNFVEGTRFLPMSLAPSLHIEKVMLGSGDSCLFIQEKKDTSLWIVFPLRLKKDSTYKLTITYSGKDIVKDLGGSNFVVNERVFWYPYFYIDCFDPAHFILKFAVPKDMPLISTGKLIKRWDDGKSSYSTWDSETEYQVSGFNYGKFSVATQESPLCKVDCYTNTYLGGTLADIQKGLRQSDGLREFLMMFPQELNTEGIGKNAAIESRNAYEVYVHFFGAIPFNKIKVSQQPQESFGQSWPTLIYLPYTSFFNEGVKDKLGLLDNKSSEIFYETVAAHEISHQWWGHTVFTYSYHDTWLEEGFATYSAALYSQTAEGAGKFKDYMKNLRKEILEKAEKGKRATEVGPIWLGNRLASIDAPEVYDLVVYSKGAYVLHMLRMMLFNFETKSDEQFISMMKDYVSTYSGRAATTEDFKKVVDKHFGENMDWFFNEWVYGTEIPVYKFSYQTEPTGDGKYLLTVTVEQKGVSSSFKMPLPLIINFENGYTVGHMLVTGDKPVKKEFKLSEKPSSVELNPWESVLCEIKQ